MNKPIYDILGIGIGPFNLGLAALTENMPGLKCIFLDENNFFNWHPGMMLPWARMQVPFHADLVTLADPCSPFSYLAFLKAAKKLFRFTILEKYFPLRSEYNEYCKWVAGQLSSLQFGMRCERVEYDYGNKIYTVYTRNTKTNRPEYFYAKHLVISIGSEPYIPACIKDKIQLPHLFHSSHYLYCKDTLLNSGDVSIIGSGQSAAEIFYDLLEHYPGKIKKLHWFTRSTFFPMDYSKFSLEMTSPEYVDYFYSLASSKKEEVLSKQGHLYKGINASLIDDIYDRMYLLSSRYKNVGNDIGLVCHSELKDIISSVNSTVLKFFQNEKEEYFEHSTQAVMLATGYIQRCPSFLDYVKELLAFNEQGQFAVHRNYSIDKNGSSIFVQNAETHTHGFNSADLGLGVYRNAVIINSILGYEHYAIEDGSVFQRFNIF